MGKKLTQEELKTIATDMIINKLPIYEATEKYNLSSETIERIGRYSRAGYDIAKEAKAKVCPKCGEALEKKMRFCWKCGTKAVTNKDEILEQAEKLLGILTCYPCNQAAEGIGIVNRIKDYIEEQSE